MTVLARITMRQITIRVRDKGTGEVVAYEYLNSTFVGGYYHIDMREPIDDEGSIDYICNTSLPKPDKLGTFERDMFAFVDSNNADVYENDSVLFNDKIYKVIFSGISFVLSSPTEELPIQFDKITKLS